MWETILPILLGALALLAGRRLFWLFVMVVGFVFGFRLGIELFGEEAGRVTAIGAGLLLALLGALLAVFAQKIAIWIAGALAMGAAANFLLLAWMPEAGLPLQAGAYVAGALVGLLLAGLLFDFLLITASTLWGAAIIVHATSPERGMALLLFIGLCVVGLLVQTASMRAQSD